MKKIIFLFAMVGYCTASAMNIAQLHDETCNGFAVRPATIQEKVDQAFEELHRPYKYWGRFPGDSGFYLLGYLDEAKIIRDLATQSKENDIYLLDVGAGQGAWGHEAMQLIQEEFSTSKKHFHIISITGMGELKTQTTNLGNITLYEFANFKIENIEAELEKHGLNLKNKVNLIVTHWTLKHLVDPLGTLKQLYDLLTPQNGMLLGDEFTICLNNVVEPFTTSGILTSLNIPVLITPFKQYILLKKDNNPLKLPVIYTQEVKGNPGDCASGLRTCFETNTELSKYDFEGAIKDPIYSFMDYKFYGTEKSRDLFNMIRDKNWFSYGTRSHQLKGT